MIYSAITIKPSERDRKPKWSWGILRDDQDRYPQKTVPNRMGFYHYPKTMKDKEAFKKLKTVLIKAHEEQLSQLTRSLNELKKLKGPK